MRCASRHASEHCSVNRLQLCNASGFAAWTAHTPRSTARNAAVLRSVPICLTHALQPGRNQLRHFLIGIAESRTAPRVFGCALRNKSGWPLAGPGARLFKLIG
jgi:hypothetical protein